MECCFKIADAAISTASMCVTIISLLFFFNLCNNRADALNYVYALSDGLHGMLLFESVFSLLLKSQMKHMV